MIWVDRPFKEEISPDFNGFGSRSKLYRVRALCNRMYSPVKAKSKSNNGKVAFKQSANYFKLLH